MFEVIKRENESQARVGVLKTAHGEIETPSYVVVGTQGEVRSLSPADLSLSKTQIVIANTYHLFRNLGEEGLKNFDGLHKKMGFGGVIMTDSGGFQVFSLGFGRVHGVGKIANIFPNEGKNPQIGHLDGKENLVRITEDGVYFMDGGREFFLDARTSIWIQERLGADIVLAFDECTSPFHGYEYTRAAAERTHKWARLCLEAKRRSDQLLYGIVQGGAFRDLREKSAKFIGSLPFDGFAIGGSLGKSRAEMFEVIRITTPFLREDRPRHLLGIGKIDDLFEAVELGIDTFDCVVPTREARHAGVWTRAGRIQITKSRYRDDSGKLDEDCACPVCLGGDIRKKDLYALFKAKDREAGRFATIHNVFFFNDLMERIRESIREGRFSEFKKEFLACLR